MPTNFRANFRATALQVGQGGSLAQQKAVEGELVHACLWAIPFVLPPLPSYSSEASYRDAALIKAGGSASATGVDAPESCSWGASAESLPDSSAVWEAVGRVGAGAAPLMHPGLRLFFSDYPAGLSLSLSLSLSPSLPLSPSLSFSLSLSL